MTSRINWLLGSGCDSVGIAVSSDSRGPRFEYSHWQKFILNIYYQQYWKDENKGKEAWKGPFKKINLLFAIIAKCYSAGRRLMAEMSSWFQRGVKYSHLFVVPIDVWKVGKWTKKRPILRNSRKHFPLRQFLPFYSKLKLGDTCVLCKKTCLTFLRKLKCFLKRAIF